MRPLRFSGRFYMRVEIDAWEHVAPWEHASGCRNDANVGLALSGPYLRWATAVTGDG